MKLINLSWASAKNLLMTGMCEQIQYQSEYSNYFHFSNGKFYSNYPGSTEIKQREPLEQHEKFNVVCEKYPLRT